MDIKPIRPKWKGTMTDRERFNKQMHYESIDRCFNMEFGYWNDNFENWNIFKDNNITNNDEADIFFNFDKFKVVSGKTFMHPTFKSKVIEEKENTIITTDGFGFLVEVPKDTHSTIPKYIRSAIETPDDWKRIKEERFDVNHPDRKINIEELKKQHPENRDYPLGVDCGSMIGRVRDMLSVEGLAYANLDYPDMVEDMVETCCVLVEDYLDQVLPHMTFDFASNWEDISCKSGPLVTVDFFKNVVMPRYKRINKKLKEHGIDIWWSDCDGDIRPLLPYFLEGGINCMFPYEVNSCTHPADLLNEYGKDLRIMGGFDKMQLIAGKDAIKKYMKTLEPLVARGGYIPFCDHRCPPDVKEEDYLYYLDLKEKTFGLK